MSKDPALLWYFNDWIGGTATMSRYLKGCYMDLLSAQFNSGPLSLDEIKTVLGTDFGSSWPTLQKKFVKDDSNCYFNERLQTEKDKRIKYSESRRKNRTYVTSYENHMLGHMENRNRNENRNEFYGEFKNVSLSEEEYQKLIEKLGESNTKLMIEELSTGIASKNYKYSSHYATILSWVRMRVKKKLEAKTKGIV